MSKRIVVKKAKLWPIHVVCNILDRISNFVYINEKFCNKNLFLDLFSVVLIEFPGFIACRICINAVVLHEMHWKRVGSAGNAKEWATAHFQDLVATENSLSR